METYNIKRTNKGTVDEKKRNKEIRNKVVFID